MRRSNTVTAWINRQRWLPTLHSRLLAVTASIFACFALATAFILWSMFAIQRSVVSAVDHTTEELVPILDLEGDVRKTELAGWTAAFAIHGGAPMFVRGNFDTASAVVADTLQSFETQDGGDFGEEASLISSARERWNSIMDRYDTAMLDEFADELELATFLSQISIEVEELVADLDAAQASALVELQAAVSDTNDTKKLAVGVALLALVGGFALVHAVTRLLCGGVVGAVTGLREGARRLAAGNWGHRVDEEGPAELAELGKSFNAMSDRLRQSHTELEHRALHDHLTGLGNRNLVADRIDHACATRQAQGRTDAFLVIDLDRFKNLNDSRGHSFGDEALIAAARRVTGCVRVTDTVARLGGDEFGVLLEGVDDIAEAEAIAQRIVTAMSSPIHLHNTEIVVTASVGIADAAGAENSAELISGADLAMYEAKQAGGSTWRFFKEHLRDQLAERVAIEADLRTAVTEDQIDIAYQAVFDLETNRPVGVEALARWTHPTAGPIGPIRFIPIAENAGFVADLGWNVLQRACTQLAAWQSDYPHLDHFSVAINIAAAHLEEANFVDRVLQITDTAGIERTNLTLEITETMMLRPGSDARNKLQRLRENGIRISIDDFGTGYSSLAQLRDYPADTLKIDQSFITGIDRDPAKQALTRTIVELADNLGLTTLAEGIETPEELATVQTFACAQAQGFFFHKPTAAVDTEALLALSIPTFTTTA